MDLLSNNTLLLRAPEPEDLDMFYRWENDTTLWRYGSTLSPYSRYALKTYLAAVTHDIYQNNELRFVIENKADAIAVGSIDLYDFEPHHRRAGVGVLVDDLCRRQGIALQAIHLLAGYAFNFLRLHQLYAYIPISNVSSLLLFEKAGFIKAGLLKEWVSTEAGYEDVWVVQLTNS